MVDLNKTLEELDGEDWGEPTFQSHLVVECHRLRHVPLSEFTIENLRILIGQKFSLEYLVPLALKQLTANPLADGDYYEGDLLLSVAQIPPQFWEAHPHLRVQWQPLLPYVAAVERSLKDDSCFLYYHADYVRSNEAWQPAFTFLIQPYVTANNRPARRSMLRKKLRSRGSWNGSA